MIKSGFVDTLSFDEIDRAIQYIDILKDCWVNRGVYSKETGFCANEQQPIDFYTLGAVTYIDGLINLPEYYRYSKDMNPILWDFFNWLYDIVLTKLSDELDEPCELISDLAHPGFHIFGAPPDKEPSPFTEKYVTMPVATIHHDLQQEKHIEIWDKFNSYDLDNALTFTLAIQVPMTGAGLCTWGDESVKKYDPESSYTQSIKKLDYGEYGTPSIVQYEEGKMFYFVGKLLHQIAPAYNPNLTDRRITLQGHGVKCDGVWKIYF